MRGAVLIAATLIAAPAMAEDWSQWKINPEKLSSLDVAEKVIECAALYSLVTTNDGSPSEIYIRFSERLRPLVASVHGYPFVESNFEEKASYWEGRPLDETSALEMMAKFPECKPAANWFGIVVDAL